MPEFGLVDDVMVRRIEVFDAKPPDPIGKGWKWLSVITVGDDPFDPATQIKEGPVLAGTIASAQVTKTFTIRNLTPAEIDANKQLVVDSIQFVILRILFNHENRIRVLEAKPAITIDQFKAALKALL